LEVLETGDDLLNLLFESLLLAACGRGMDRLPAAPEPGFFILGGFAALSVTSLVSGSHVEQAFRSRCDFPLGHPRA
jgi:hypothetical protein